MGYEGKTISLISGALGIIKEILRTKLWKPNLNPQHYFLPKNGLDMKIPYPTQETINTTIQQNETTDKYKIHSIRYVTSEINLDQPSRKSTDCRRNTEYKQYQNGNKRHYHNLSEKNLT